MRLYDSFFKEKKLYTKLVPETVYKLSIYDYLYMTTIHHQLFLLECFNSSNSLIKRYRFPLHHHYKLMYINIYGNFEAINRTILDNKTILLNLLTHP